MSSVELEVEGELPGDVRERIDRYRDQGGLLGVVAYTLLYLETEDEGLAADAARIPTTLFVASSLHDDAIDDTERTGEKSSLNYRITAGDLFFARAMEAVSALPPDVDAESITAAVRAIGSGQLVEESTPERGDLGSAIDRIERRGSVWGDLAIAVVGASGRYPESQLEHLATVVWDLLFVFTVYDDIADLREDRANGVTTAPMLIYADGRPEGAAKADVETMLDSDLTDRIEAILEWRETRIDCAARLWYAATDHADEELLDALDRALTWYCESVCSTPVAETVPPAVRDDIRTAIDDEAERKRLFAEFSATVPSALLASDAVPEPIDDWSAERLEPVVSKLLHVFTLVDSGLVTSVDEAVASARSPPTASVADETPDPSA